MRKFWLITWIAFSFGQSLAQTKPESSTRGKCSFYSTRYNGRKTASGEKFDSDALTAAHRTLPMGTKVKVTNLANNKSVEVKINDRGPFVKGREISVTRHAAKELGFIKQGVTDVRIEPAK